MFLDPRTGIGLGRAEFRARIGRLPRPKSGPIGSGEHGERIEATLDASDYGMFVRCFTSERLSDERAKNL